MGGELMSWPAFFILGIVPYGQIFARVKYLNGSIDKAWMFWLAFPPLTWYALWQIKKGNVAMGNGTQVYDFFMIIPIIAKVMLPLILSFIPWFKDEDGELDDESLFYKIISVGAIVGAVTLPYLIRAYRNCKTMTPALFVRACMNGVISSAVPNILILIFSFIPILGTVVDVMQSLPYIGQFVNAGLWSVFFCGTYIITNMFNQGTPETMCSPGLTGTIKDKIFFTLACIYTIISNLPFFSNLL
jgi:hypothetical protein